MQTVPTSHHSSREVLPESHCGASNGLQLVAELGENREQGRGRIEEPGVGLKGREVAESFHPARLGKGWFHTGRPGTRDSPSGTGEHSPLRNLCQLCWVPEMRGPWSPREEKLCIVLSLFAACSYRL